MAESCMAVVSDIAVFVLKRDVKLQPTNQPCMAVLITQLQVIAIFELNNFTR